MEVLDPGTRPAVPRRSVAAVGRFDGVHLGHRAVLHAVCESARELGARPAVVVVDPDMPSPSEGRAGTRICTLDIKLELLAAEGVEMAVVLAGQHISSLARILDEALGAVLLVSGGGPPDHSATITPVPRVPVRRIPPVRHGDGDAIAAASVLGLIARGAVEEAAALLGRPHQVRGVVEHGDARGRTLGFPTANIAVPADVALPSDGVYAGQYTGSHGTTYLAAISLGRRPTFYEERGARLLEAHLLDVDADLYGDVGSVTFERLLRRQRKFDTVGELVTQLGIDVDATRGSPR